MTHGLPLYLLVTASTAALLAWPGLLPAWCVLMATVILVGILREGRA